MQPAASTRRIAGRNDNVDVFAATSLDCRFVAPIASIASNKQGTAMLRGYQLQRQQEQQQTPTQQHKHQQRLKKLKQTMRIVGSLLLSCEGHPPEHIL